jgi:hypothetical protein
MRYQVIQPRASDYPDPLILYAGESITAGALCTIPGWEDWRMCQKGGKNGWVPRQILQISAPGRALVLEDYSAHELTVQAGDVLNGERVLNGWVWGRLERNPAEPGWTPLEVLAPIHDD